MRLCVLMVTLQTRSHSLLSCHAKYLPKTSSSRMCSHTVLYVEENAEVMTVDFLLALGESESQNHW